MKRSNNLCVLRVLSVSAINTDLIHGHHNNTRICSGPSGLRLVSGLYTRTNPFVKLVLGVGIGDIFTFPHFHHRRFAGGSQPRGFGMGAGEREVFEFSCSSCLACLNLLFLSDSRFLSVYYSAIRRTPG